MAEARPSQEPRALVKNAADEEQVREGTQKETDRRNDNDDALWAVANSPPGQQLLWRLLAYCGVFTRPLGPDDRHTNYNIGRGDVGRMLLAEIGRVHPDALFRMMREHAPELGDAQ